VRSADQIFNRDRGKPALIDVPEWPIAVYARKLSAQDQIDLSEGVDPKDLTFKLILHCVIDENGDRIFSDEDEQGLRNEEFPVIMRVFAAVAKLNGLSTKELEEAMENFGPAPVDEYSSTG
jgi:hypothetical protein